MQVTVFGANGKVGRLVVKRLLDNDHSVVAFIHNNSDLVDHAKLTLVRGDVHREDDVQRAVQGSNAVICALSSWHSPEKNVLSSCVERLVPAMRNAKITRVVSVTGAGSYTSHPNPSLFDSLQHTVLNFVAPKVLRDSEEHIRLLAESGLDCTVVRSPIMTDSGPVGYLLAQQPPMPWQTIHRQAVANCLVNLVLDNSYSKQAPYITRPSI